MKKTLGAIAAASVLCTAAWAETIVPTAVAYDEYGAVEGSLTGTPGNVENGAVLMNKGAGNCVACHQIGALPELAFQGEIGPPLDGAASRWTEAELRGIVANAKLMFEDTMMPAFYKTEGFIRPGKAYTGEAADETFGPVLTAQQIEDVVAYLKTLKE